MTSSLIIQFVISTLAFVLGVFSLIKIHKKHQRIDTESVAIVEEVTDLGRSDGRKVYAIKYAVKCSSPFNVYETPCKKERKLGLERTIYFEKEDPKNNHYFKTIGQLDRRYIMPICIILCGVVILAAAIISMF